MLLINSDINILGGLPDFNLILYYFFKSKVVSEKNDDHYAYTSIKTIKSVKRFENAINETLLRFPNNNIESLFGSVLSNESISHDSLILLFWNASYNNNLFHYLNTQVYFTSFYSGRIGIKQEEVLACIKELKEKETGLKKWSESTLSITSSKYLTLLKKFNLMEGAQSKNIIHPYLNDKMFVLFVYWLKAIESRPNLLESTWLQYSFFDRGTFVERALQKKYSQYYQLTYSGDNLKIETTIPYFNIYDVIK